MFSELPKCIVLNDYNCMVNFILCLSCLSACLLLLGHQGSWGRMRLDSTTIKPQCGSVEVLWLTDLRVRGQGEDWGVELWHKVDHGWVRGFWKSRLRFVSQCGLCVVCASCRDENFVDRIRDQKSRKANQFLGSMEPAFSRRYPSVTTGQQQLRM